MSNIDINIVISDEKQKSILERLRRYNREEHIKQFERYIGDE